MSKRRHNPAEERKYRVQCPSCGVWHKGSGCLPCSSLSETVVQMAVDQMSIRHLKRLRTYRLLPADFARMYLFQDKACAICQQKAGAEDLVIDHDHKSGKVRGLLCGTCNTGIGMLKDRPDWARRAVGYLLRSPSERIEKYLANLDAG